MKLPIPSVFLLAMLQFSCGETKTSQDKTVTAVKQNSNEAKADNTGENANTIMGDWLLYYVANDDNGNRKIDDAEMANAVQHWGRSQDKRKAVWHFDANGSFSSTEENTKTGEKKNTSPPGSTWKIKKEAGGDVLYIYEKGAEEYPGKALIIKNDGKELQWVYIDEMQPGMIHMFKRS